MQKHIPDLLSNQELDIMARQSGVLISRYHMKTKILENLYDDPEKRFGIPLFTENVPESVIELGLVSPEHIEEYRLFYKKMRDGIPSGSLSVKLRIETGEYRWHHSDYSLVYDDQGEPIYAFVSFFDNTEEREMELAAEKWQLNISSITSDPNLCLYVEINLTRDILETLQSNTHHGEALDNINTYEDVIVFGMRGEMDEADRREYCVFFDRQRLLGLFSMNVNEDHYDYCMIKENGNEGWVKVHVGMIKYPYSEDIMARISFTNIKNLTKDMEQLSHKASHDPLTGLLNREGIDQRLQGVMNTYDPKQTTALFMIDLDDFKQINDHLGHQVGDLVLREVADTLLGIFRKTDIVGRLGGDEFIVFLKEGFDYKFIEKRAAKLLSDMRLTMNGKGKLLISVSVGIAYGKTKQDFDRWYKLADMALYSAKRAGKNRYHVINIDTYEERAYQIDETSGMPMSLQSLLQQNDGLLSQHKSPYEALIENIPGGVVMIEVMKTSARIIHCNDWSYRYGGYEKEELDEMQKDNPFVIVHPDDLPQVAKYIEDANKGLKNINICYRIKHKDGYYKHVALSASMTEQLKDKIVFHGIFTDIDELMNVQNELDITNKKLDSIIRAIPGGIAIFEISDDLAITHIGDWAYQRCGYSQEEIEESQGTSQLDSIHPDDLETALVAIQSIRDGADTFDLVVRLQIKDGTYFHANIKGSIISRTPEKATMYTIFTENQ